MSKDHKGEGWVSVYRSVMSDDLWHRDKINYAQAWLELIMLTNHKARDITIKNGKQLRINRGECGWSVLSLSKRWGWSTGKVNRFLDYLTERQKIERKTVENHTVIKIINYEKYQNGQQTNLQKEQQKIQQAVQQPKRLTDTNNKVNNQNNENNIGAGHPKHDSGELERLFEVFWKAHPSGMNNLGAWSEWKRAVCKADPQVIIAGAERYAAFCRENKIEREYIKYADNWLREELWNNAYELPEKERQLPPTERDELRAEALKWKLERNIFVRQDEKNWLKRWEEKRRK